MRLFALSPYSSIHNVEQHVKSIRSQQSDGLCVFVSYVNDLYDCYTVALKQHLKGLANYCQNYNVMSFVCLQVKDTEVHVVHYT